MRVCVGRQRGEVCVYVLLAICRALRAFDTRLTPCHAAVAIQFHLLVALPLIKYARSYFILWWRLPLPQAFLWATHALLYECTS